MANFVNPHAPQPISLISLAKSIIKNHQLILAMVKREVIGRYKGSVFGLAWSFFTPIVMLAIYTFVFSVVFQTRWIGGQSGDRTEFALNLFIGMIVYGVFSEVINKAPTLIISNANYVKKVIFPLEILCMVSIGAAYFHFMVSFFILATAFILINGWLNWTIIFIPFVLLPFVIITLGISWGIASLGVFMRSIGHSVGIFTTVLMFLSPIFYPIAAVPEKFQFWMLFNPSTFIIEQVRNTLISGQIPDWIGLSRYLSVALLILWLGYACFQKTRKGFADVL
jgi:lipopolysaccharide transport system permease protein